MSEAPLVVTNTVLLFVRHHLRFYFRILKVDTVTGLPTSL